MCHRPPRLRVAAQRRGRAVSRSGVPGLEVAARCGTAGWQRARAARRTRGEQLLRAVRAASDAVVKHEEQALAQVLLRVVRLLLAPEHWAPPLRNGLAGSGLELCAALVVKRSAVAARGQEQPLVRLLNRPNTLRLDVYRKQIPTRFQVLGLWSLDNYRPTQNGAALLARAAAARGAQLPPSLSDG